jgi:hypothetical protein
MRTLSIAGTFAVATSLSARTGPSAAAAHQVGALWSRRGQQLAQWPYLDG